MTTLSRKQPRGKFMPADFDPNQFSQMTWERGARLIWEQAEVCPCRESTDSDAGRRGCPVCGALGWIFHTPTEIRAIVTSAVLNEDTMNRIGPDWRGSVNVTVEPENLPSRFDRYTHVESVMIMRELVTRTAGTTQALKLPIIRRTLDDVVGGPITVGVLRCRAATSTDFGAAAPLVEGVDLDVTGGGLIDWTKGDALGTAPAVGKQFSISYTAHPVYVVLDLPYVIRDSRLSPKSGVRGNAELPIKTLCKLKFGA